MAKWHMDSVKALKTAKKGYNVLIDMSKMGALPQDAKAELEKGQELYRRMGMSRSAVIVPSRLVAKQLKDVAATSKIANTERYISVEEPAAEQKAIAWLVEGKEPV